MANWKPGNWLDRTLSREITIHRGTFVTTLENLARRSKVTLRSLRTALITLSKLGILTKRSTNHATYITLLNFAQYQDSLSAEATRQLTLDWQTDDTQPPRIEEVKDVKKKKKTPMSDSAAPATSNVHDLAAALVSEFKLRKKLPADDASWDSRHRESHLALATELIGICGSFEDAKKCLIDKATALDAAELFNWNFETVVNHAHEWKAGKGRKADTKVDGGAPMDYTTARAGLARLLTTEQLAIIRQDERHADQLIAPFLICQRFGLKPAPLTREMEAELVSLRRKFHAELNARRRAIDPNAPPAAGAFWGELTVDECHEWEDYVRGMQPAAAAAEA